MDSVIELARRPVLDLAPEVSGALCYFDAGAAEAVQLSVGLPLLLGIGAANVCALEEAHPDDALLPALLSPDGRPPATLAVFVTQLLTDAHQQIMHALMVHPHVSRCLVYVSVSEHAHALQAATVLGVEAYREYTSWLEQHIEEARQAVADAAAAAAPAGTAAPQQHAGGPAHAVRVRVQVKHLPLHMCALDSSTFVLPAASAAASLAKAGGRPAGFAQADTPQEGEEEEAMGASGGLSLLANALVDLAAQMSMRMDAFSLGPVAQQIAKEFASLPQRVQREGGASGHDALAAAAGDVLGAPAGPGPNSMALLLIDRSLDLATPCMHGDHVLDMALALLPRRGAAAAAGPLLAGGRGGRAHWRPADVRVDTPQLAPSPGEFSSGGGGGSGGDGSASTSGRRSSSDSAPAARSANTLKAASRSTSASSSDAAAAAGGDAPTAAASTSSSAPSSCAAGSGGFTTARGGLSLFAPSDKRAVQWLEQLAAKRGKDSAALVRKWLKDALRQEKVAPAERVRLSSTVAPSELRMLAASLAAAPDAALKQLPVIGLGYAAAEALGCPAALRWAALAALEHQLLLCLPEGSDMASMLLPALLDALHQVAEHKGPLVADDLLQLITVLYSLSGDLLPPHPPFYSEDERRLKEALTDALAAAAPHEVASLPEVQQTLRQHQQQRQQQLLGNSGGGAGAQDDSYEAAGLRAELSDRVGELFARLKWLAAARGKLRDVRRLMAPGLGDDPAAEAVPLVRQVLAKVLLQADNRDLQQPATSQLRGLLSMGLGRLGLGSSLAAGLGGSSGRSRVSEYPAVLVFMVGGISPAEVRAVAQELDQHTFGHKPRVILGGTALLAPDDVVRQALG